MDELSTDQYGVSGRLWLQINGNSDPGEHWLRHKEFPDDVEYVREIVWQPIETAPKDETTVLVFGNGDVTVAYYRNRSGEWIGLIDGMCVLEGGAYSDMIALSDVTHWMPLPKAPYKHGE